MRPDDPNLAAKYSSDLQHDCNLHHAGPGPATEGGSSPRCPTSAIYFPTGFEPRAAQVSGEKRGSLQSKLVQQGAKLFQLESSMKVLGYVLKAAKHGLLRQVDFTGIISL